METEEVQLNIIGYGNQPVPHVLYQQAGQPPRGLAVLLPGFGYTNDMPLMFYAEQAAGQAGLDVLRVDYAYNRDPQWEQMPDAARTERLCADVDAALQAGLAHRDYAQIVIIGKSLGTRAMAHLLENSAHLPPARWVWLTPVLSDPALRRGILQYHPRSLAVIGTADPFYDFAVLGELFQPAEDRVEIIENANHGLIIPGNVSASLQALTQSITALSAFIQ